MSRNRSYVRAAKSLQVSDRSLPSEKRHLNEVTVSKEKDWDREDESESFRRQKMDSMTEMLGCSSYYYKMRWPWLKQEVFGVTYPLEVDRFYQERNLAIDFKEDSIENRKTKEDLFKAHGIEYAIVKTPDEFKKLAKRLS